MGASCSRPKEVTAGTVFASPPDGHCLFHSLVHGMRRMGRRAPEARALRQQLARYLERPKRRVSGALAQEWIAWETGLGLEQYCNELRMDRWGSGLELAAFAQQRGIEVHVFKFEPATDRFRRVALFASPNKRSRYALCLEYQDNNHYNLLLTE